MMQTRTTLIIVTGKPGAGKTTLARKLAETLTYPMFSKDDFKETVFDALNPDVELSARHLANLSYALLYMATDRLLASRKSIIVESNFSDKFDRARFVAFANKYPQTTIIQILCEVDDQLAFARFKQRHQNGERHRVHRSHETFDDFQRELLQDVHLLTLPNAKTIYVNTNNFSAIEYEKIVDSILRSNSK